ncbi:hypothetical protein K470DRAFT_259725 [Piedraia hortae CBS 480.64]|uniref:Uncharacterized protein n=1 Tax=Piedraia hortae CBS 480.64 TaxID=1314780 RepID=A0A6A7BT85_9PEZI|nr:hypothetical protein K470DRAFT_259725 [Piedraia hortae CBS 480.64]
MALFKKSSWKRSHQHSQSLQSRDQLRTPSLVSASSASTLEVPPELAHLNVDPPKRPRRPSRDNTPNLVEFLSTPSPVIKSELPSYYAGYRPRNASQETLSSQGTSPVLARTPKSEGKSRRRGPAAGTGHEGYGRFGFRRGSPAMRRSPALRSPSIGSDSSARDSPLSPGPWQPAAKNFAQRAHALQKSPMPPGCVLMESVPLSLHEIEKMVREPETPVVEEAVPASNMVPYEERHYDLLPPPTTGLNQTSTTLESPLTRLMRASQSAAQTLPQSPPQSRLSPIGRIPKIVPKRKYNSPDNSFSRPFNNRPHSSLLPPRPPLHSAPVQTFQPPLQPYNEAFTPQPSQIAEEPIEEDHWAEYDDLVEDYLSDAPAEAPFDKRLAALLTSKWLSADRVLFSPAHNEIRLSEEPRVLVVDGLGSDWSYNVAINYHSAKVYDLGPTKTPPELWPELNGKPPSNYRHVQYSHGASFPFPQAFFNAVVFRFPVATTDDAYSFYMSECKRVLRPGGHLEVSVLDMDLSSAGPLARRDVRNLKMRLQSLDSTISLRNLSDLMIRLMAKNGLENLQRCFVGVPVAGKGEMEKTMSRVGQWWYSTCYERWESIWRHQNLLEECEAQGTSFRLMIAYAQKPVEAKRRTASV